MFNSFTCDLGVDKVDNRVEMGRIENVDQLYRAPLIGGPQVGRFPTSRTERNVKGDRSGE